MVGLGEERGEITELLSDLRKAGVEMLTIGQYLCPDRESREVVKFYHPDEFEEIRLEAEAMGFAHVAAGPFVRSSYHAEISFQEKQKGSE
jgi:lipoic acid synthetase